MDNSMLLCLGFIVLILVVGIAVYVQNQKDLEKARKRYLEGLEILRMNPDNVEVREEALLRGRTYVAKAGKRGTFTEVSLMNDLNAIQPGIQSKSTQNDARDVKTRLVNLESLYIDGVITKEEYEKQRQSILGDI